MTLANAAPRPRILIAEDNYLIANEVEEFIRGCGYAVAGSTPSVEAGLALIAEGAVDGAILDIDLAGRTSFPMCRALNAKGVPFLFLTAYGPRAIVPAEFSAAPHLTKPFEPMTLQSVLQDLVGVPPEIPAVMLQSSYGNAILDTLDEESREAIGASLERSELRRGDLLDAPGQPVAFVYFPVDCLISIFFGATPATRIEVASIGRDGLTAPGVLVGDRIPLGRTIVQAAGSAWRIDAQSLQRLAESDIGLRRQLLGHAGTLIRRLAETVSYSGRATIVERLAHWLLQATHRLHTSELNVTHDVLAEILGVRRPSVTTGLQMLEGKRLIRSTRRAIVVLDPEGLTALSRR